MIEVVYNKCDICNIEENIFRRYLNTYYWISNIGNIYSSKSKKFLKSCYSNKGYKYLTICMKEKRKMPIHKLVALTFHNLIEGKEIIDHIDRNKIHNCINNLRWVNHSENNSNVYNVGKIFKYNSLNSWRFEYQKRTEHIRHRKRFKNYNDALLYQFRYITQNKLI